MTSEWKKGFVALVLGGSVAVAGGAAAGQTAGTAPKPQNKPVAEVYKIKCQMCHAAKGDSPMPGMSFADGVWKHGSSVNEVAQTIRDGVPGTAMMPFKNQLSEQDILALAKFVRQFDPKLKGAKGTSGN